MKPSVIRSALLILSGNAFASLLLLLRNLIVARMIPVADYGIASTFAVAMAVIEMASALGLQQQIVQAKEGDDPKFQAALQGFQVLRGVFSSALLFFVAGWMADFMGIPEVTAGYRMLALVPVLNALVHFDMYRLNRQMVFWPMLLTGAVPALISVLVLWPLAHWFGDWRVMLYSILVQSALGAVVSQVLARRPYRLVLDRAIMTASLRFGWPLLINSVLLFFVFQGDRLIVGREWGMVDLAIFSMGVTLTLTPTLVMAKSAQNLLLPHISAVRGDPVQFGKMALVTLQMVLVMALGFSQLMLLLGVPVTRLLVGAKYAALLPLIFLFAIQQSVRVFKSGPATVALARGRTANAMLANLPRVVALPLCWYVAATTGNVAQLLWFGTAAEIIGCVVALWLVKDVIDMASRGFWLPHAIAGTLLLGTSLWQAMDPHTGIPSWPVWLIACTGMAVCLASMQELLIYLRTRHPLNNSPLS